MTDYIDIVFDKLPGPDGATFVEVENSSGASIRFGEWIVRDDGLACLRIVQPETKEAFIVWGNTDNTEGRGEQIPIAITEKESTAIRQGLKAGVQGSNIKPEPCTLIKRTVGWRPTWFGPVRISEPSEEDLRVQNILDRRKTAEDNAISAGLSRGDIDALGMSV